MFDEVSYRILLSLRDGGPARFKDLRLIVKNPRTLSIKLEKLRQLGLVEGGGTYRLTPKGFRVARALEELDKALHSPGFRVLNIERIPHMYFAPLMRRYCEALHSLLEERLVSVMLFGSVARGDWDRNSDIDVLVVAQGWEGRPVWERFRELRRAKMILEESPEYREAVRAGYWPVIQNYPLSVEEAGRFNRVYLDAVVDGIILYDKNGYLTGILESLRKRLEEMGSVRVTLPNRRFYWVLKRGMRAGEVITLG